jgi:hypothetical protein
VAEQQRQTKRERREQAREQRRRQAEEQARRQRQQALRTGLFTLGGLAVVGVLVYLAFFMDDESLEDAILVSSDEIAQAQQGAACEPLVEREPLEDSSHFDRNQAPPADLIYPDIRPTHSGPHTEQVVPPISAGSPTQIDEYTSTHNLEHGAVIVWYDPDQLDESTVDEMTDWAQLLNNSGFQQQGGTAIFVSPYVEPGISSGKAVALRAWGTAVDCDEWDETVANGFVAEHYGTRGIGPEAAFAPYPGGVLEISDRDPEELEREAEEADAAEEAEEPHDAEEAELGEVTGDEAVDGEGFDGDEPDDEVTDGDD